MSAIAKATWLVRSDFSERAAALGTYPSSSAADITRRTVSSRVGRPFSTRETEAIETPARCAIVVIVGPLATATSGSRCRCRKRLQDVHRQPVNVYGSGTYET